MSSVVEAGDKLHIMARRLFEEDLRRHFVGEVLAAEGALAKLRGYTFIFDGGTNEYRRLPGLRTRIFSLGESGYVVNQIPGEVDVAAISYESSEGSLVITDGGSFSLPINEFGPAR